MMKARSESVGGVEGLRKWSPAEQAQLLEEALQPGVTLASVADKHGISLVFSRHCHVPGLSAVTCSVSHE
jgi:transposase-like protein